MKTFINPSKSQWEQICKRPEIDSKNLESVISNVFKRIQNEGDDALLAYTKQYDGVASSEITVNLKQLNIWAKQIPNELKIAIDTAYININNFHKAQKNSLKTVETITQPGVKCWREVRPIERVGLYIPGGSAPLFSTVLMLGIPAKLAGCKQIVLCTPPQADGTINPAVCYAAKLIEATNIICAGGAQAIAAITFGTSSVPKVDKIFGPGNQYVTAAKLYAMRYGVAIDIPAGPSEVMVIADKSAQPNFVAADLLSQAEHGPDSQVILITTDESIVKAVKAELSKQLAVLPRKDIAAKALENSVCVVVNNAIEAVELANCYAPEHLILSIKQAKNISKKIINAGSVFLSNYTPESAGDYASGTNHTLPTNGWAKSYSGLSLESFCKFVTFQSISKMGAGGLASTVMAMAEAEGLDAHKRAMEIRL